MTKRVATVEARMTSSRLPGKVLMEVAGKPILFYLIERLKMVKEIDEIVIATTTNSEDDCLEDFATVNKVKCFRGSEDDVMERVLKAGISFEAEEIVEITGDCPLIDPEIVTQVINVFEANKPYYAIYDEIDGLQVGSAVRLNGFNVGMVNAIVLNDNNNLLVTLNR